MKTIEGGLDVLDNVVGTIVDALPHGGVVVLQGDLASGKTTLTQAMARFMGIDEAVTSPTFSLQQRYGERLYHYDLYNHGIEHFLALGLLEALEAEGYHFVEWGDETLLDLLEATGLPHLRVEIEKSAPDARRYKVYHA